MLTVFNYCSNMLETQEYRDVALEHVVEICREECEREKAKSRMLPACISHCNGQVCLLNMIFLKVFLFFSGSQC